MGKIQLKKANPLISIALCTYNGEKHLEEQLKSIIAQSYKNIEIVAVDDCSGDDSISILNKYANKITIHIYSNSANLGYIKNFEKAVSLCEGDFIALCDQDDIWEPHKLERLLEEIKDNMLIYSDSELVDERGNLLNKRISSIRNFIKGHHPESFLFHNCVAGHTVMFRKELKQYIFPFPREIYHDWWIAYTATSVGSITYVEECLVNYRQHGTANTDMLHLRTPKRVEETSKSNKTIEKTRGIVKDLTTYYNLKHLSEKDRKFIGDLMKAYESRINVFFSLSLFLILSRNWKRLYHIPKDPWIYKIVHVLKESLGSKLKTAYYKYKEKKISN